MGADTDFIGRMGPELELLLPRLDERSRRLVLGAVARAAGDGGITAVAKAAGASWQTVADGADELASGDDAGPGRVRRPGGGRKKPEEHDPRLIPALRELLEASTRGDPMSLITWTTLSVRGIAAELTQAGRPCAKNAVLRMLHAEGFSTQGNSRAIEGRRHPDRDAQFRYINDLAKRYLAAADPVISIDTKKKELIGLYARKGREWRVKGDPRRVRDHDFPDSAGGKAIPYGVYDIGDDSGFVNVGTDHDTAQFAAESVRRWWDATGKDRYPHAARLLVTCDAGGSSGYRPRAWKAELARLAAETGLEITVCHFPPGTSKWNKIEHRLFCHITRTWRGRPLMTPEEAVAGIAATTTYQGLKCTAVLDDRDYPEGAEVPAARIRHLEERVLDRDRFHGEWNYTVRPAPAQPQEQAPGPGPDLDALAALAGIGDLGALLAALAAPWQADREHRLALARGRGSRKQASGPAGPFRLPFEAIVAAAACHLRLRMTYRLLGEVFGTHPSTISEAAARIIPRLEARGITPQAGTRITTLAGLHEHAAAGGITITGITTQTTRESAHHDDDTPGTANLKNDASIYGGKFRTNPKFRDQRRRGDAS